VAGVYCQVKSVSLFTHNILFHFLGRVSRQAAKIVHPSHHASAQSKLNRRNHAKQIQLQKRQSLLSAVRIFGGVDGAPRVVAVVPLCEGVTSRDVVSSLSRSLELPIQTDQECSWKIKFVPLFFSLLLRVFSPYVISPKGGTI
jgi:pre-rRNA-processing protein TSR1